MYKQRYENLVNKLKSLNGSAISINYICEEDVCLLVCRDVENRIHILHEEESPNLSRAEGF